MNRLTRLISVGCSAIRCTSAASIASTLLSDSSVVDSLLPASDSATRAAVVPYARRMSSPKASGSTPSLVTGSLAIAAISSAAAKSSGLNIATIKRPRSIRIGTERTRTATSGVNKSIAAGSVSGGFSTQEIPRMRQRSRIFAVSSAALGGVRLASVAPS